MRKVETQATNAMLALSKNPQPFSKNFGRNDRVECVAGEVTLYLFSNPIAKIRGGSIHLSDCGYQSMTTKSRLNAVLYAFDLRSNLCQKAGQWYLDGQTWDGQATLDTVHR